VDGQGNLIAELERHARRLRFLAGRKKPFHRAAPAGRQRPGVDSGGKGEVNGRKCNATDDGGGRSGNDGRSGTGFISGGFHGQTLSPTHHCVSGLPSHLILLGCWSIIVSPIGNLH